MLIFGFGPGKAQDLGEVAPTVCPFCHNSVFLHFIRSKKSVRLYFVPVVPYGTDEYLLCPICTRGLQLSNEQSPSVGAMQGTTAAFRQGRLAEPDYLARVSQFWAAIGVNPGGEQVLQATAPGATVGSSERSRSTGGGAPPPPPPAHGAGRRRHRLDRAARRARPPAPARRAHRRALRGRQASGARPRRTRTAEQALPPRDLIHGHTGSHRASEAYTASTSARLRELCQRGITWFIT